MLRRYLNYFAAFLLLAPLLIGRAEAGPYAALVVEVESERVLYAKNADDLRHPASLTKMMTLYMVFDALSRGELSLNDRLPTSAYAASRSPSKLGLRPGDTITVEEGILGLVTQSANDAATVFAEALGGSEFGFAYQMTQRARQLGMTNTVFRNASGLPDPNQVTTAWDMYRLGRALLKNFPQYYTYFSTDRFVFRNRSFHNHNHLLDSYPGTDGIKTGFVNASGYNLVASARRDGNRLIGVVFGGATHARRDAHMREILDDGFAQLQGREPETRIAALEPPETPTLLRRPPEELPPTLKRKSAKALRAMRDQAQGDIVERKDKPGWQVRVGVFAKEEAAEQRLSQALRTAPFPLRHAQGAVSARGSRGRKSYVAYFKGISQEEASDACKALRRKRMECAAALVVN